MTVSKKGKKRVEAITFDVGGTLIECWPSVGHVYAEVAARHGHPGLSPGVLNQNFKSAWSQLRGFRHTREQWAALVDATFVDLVDPAPSSSFFPALYERFSKPDAWHVFDDVVPTLSALKSRGIALGIISNWDDRLRPLLGKLELSEYFDSIVVSCETGANKPDKALFVCASRALGCPPANVLHVGDSFEMDVLGALGAGLQARWLRRHLKSNRGSAIRSLGALDKL